MLRVYIDDFTPPIWEIDSGTGTASRKFEKVITEAIGVYKYDLDADNTTNPKAWVEYPAATLIVIGNIAILR